MKESSAAKRKLSIMAISAAKKAAAIVIYQPESIGARKWRQWRQWLNESEGENQWRRNGERRAKYLAKRNNGSGVAA